MRQEVFFAHEAIVLRQMNLLTRVHLPRADATLVAIVVVQLIPGAKVILALANLLQATRASTTPVTPAKQRKQSARCVVHGSRA